MRIINGGEKYLIPFDFIIKLNRFSLLIFPAKGISDHDLVSGISEQN